MVEYRITDESKAEAKRKFLEAYWGSENPPGIVSSMLGRAFIVALEALCVPVDDSWRPMSGKPHTSFRKGQYRLEYRGAGLWQLTWPEAGKGVLIDTFVCSVEAPTHMSTIQAWADEQIAEHEAQAIVDQALKSGRISPGQREWAMEWCRRDRRAFQDFVARAPVVQYKPFGPGTRLRAVHGDDILIVGNVTGQEVMVVNLTINTAIALPDSYYWHSPEFTEAWLIGLGATVIE